VLLLLYVAIMVPLRTGFDADGKMAAPLTTFWWLELFVDIYFVGAIWARFGGIKFCGRV
jgi:hypothetical protein